MMFRFTLSHDILGELEISPPDGWKDAVLKLERDKNFHSLIEYFDGSFIFYGNNGEVNGGIDFIRQVESEYGFDADLNILIEITVDGYTYDTVFTGLLKLEAIQETVDNKMQVPIIRNDFWSKFINRLDTPVDIQSERSLDNGIVNISNSINLSLSSQKIQKKYIGEMNDSFSILSEDFVTSNYVQIDTDLEVLNEIQEKHTLPRSVNPDIPVSLFTMDESGVYDFDLRIESSFIWRVESPTEFCETEEIIRQSGNKLEFYFKKNNETPIVFTKQNYTIPANVDLDQYEDPVSTVHYFSIKMFLNKGDEIRIYGDITANASSPSGGDDDGVGEGTYNNFIVYSIENNHLILVETAFYAGGGECVGGGGVMRTRVRQPPSGLSTPTYFNVVGQTEYPKTNAFSFLLHDTAGQITDRIINQNQSFYSEFLGSDRTIYRQYDNDGCGWKYALVKGLQLRQYSLIEKPFFQSFKSWWDGANPILNLGLGYDVVGEDEVIRVEQKEYFYDSDISVYIPNVQQITRVYDSEVNFKTVKIGYKQWQSENISGIDDPQTKHTYASRLQKSGTDITLESEFIAASLAIETTRRTTREKSADYKFDNETFIIAINPIPIDVSPETSPDVNDFMPELDENFTSINNLLNPESRYNTRLTPARNFIRWINYLSGGLQSYLGSVFKFTAGEGNYDTETDMVNTSDGCDEFKLPLSEKQDIPISDDYIHLSQLFEIRVPMEWDEYKTIRDNRSKAIAISQTYDNFVTCFVKEINYEIAKSQATITIWSKELMRIIVPESVPEMVECVPRTVYPLTVDNTNITVDNDEITVDQDEYTI